MKEEQKKQEEQTPLKPLNVMGDLYQTRYTRKYEKRTPWAKPDVKKVKSFIPGTVRELTVKPGDSVAANQKMLVLEAMKMMNTIYAPFAGKIKAVNIAIGDCIPKGTVMIEFE
ncbi:MAG TPA: acetyl-CoA carboxylase biotin carboxyl carrier protein subunit [Bacteroidales bacterium]|nr:acetyl-CoA carboxylase biotin carboxyl carrier protein subunit [Bacteroidales bacterium]